MISKRNLVTFLKEEKILIYFTIVFIIVAILFSFFSPQIGIKLYRNYILKRGVVLNQIFDKEKEDILNKVKTIGSIDDIKSYTSNRDTPNLINLLRELQKFSGLTQFTVVDKNGVAMARVPYGKNIGDNVFLTLPIGRIASKGISTVMYTSGRNFPLSLGASYPILNTKGEIAGAILGGNWLNNDTAKRLKKEYLHKDEEIVFYSKNEGLIGSSFNSTSSKRLLNVYVNHGSSFVQQGTSGEIIHIENKDYIIYNKTFFNSDSDLGGVLLLIPLPYTLHFRATMVGIILTFIFLIIFLFIKPLYSFENLTKKKRLVVFFFVLISAVVFVLSTYITYETAKTKITDISKSKFNIYNSTLKIKPDSGVYNIGDSQTISVIVKTGGEAINAIDTILRYDPTVLHIDSVSTDNSFCSPDLFITKSIDNNLGIIDIACGVSGNGFSEDQSVLADITFTPIKEGLSQIIFDDGTTVLAADGLGTNVLRYMTGASYDVFDKKKLGILSKIPIPVMFSTSHPNSSQWYNSRIVNVDWVAEPNTIYLYRLDTSTSTDTSLYNVTASNYFTTTAPKDGIYYFHLALKKDGIIGPTKIIKINIDTEAPNIPTIRASSLNVKKGEIVRLEFGGQDGFSGIQKNFYIKVDDGIFLPTAQKLYIPFDKSGQHIITLRIFDNAENYSETKVTINVSK